MVIVCCASFQCIAADSLRHSEFRHKVFTEEHGLPDNEVLSLLQSSDGYMWIGTRSGLARFDGLRFKTFSHVDHPEFVTDFCSTLAEDTDGALWIGTSDGLLRYSQGLFMRFDLGGDGGIAALHASGEHGLWVAGPGGLWRYKNGQLEKFLRQGFSYSPFGFATNSTRSLFIGDQHGVLEYDPLSDFLVLHKNPLYPAGSRANALTGLGERFILFSSELHAKPQLYEFAAGQWRLLSERLHDNARGAYFIVRDQEGRAWISGMEDDIDIFDGSTIKDAPISFPEDDVPLCLLHDREGNVWVGAEQTGLHLFTRLPVQSMTMRDGLPNSNIWAFAEARDGTVWVGTDGGLAGFNSHVFTNYSEVNGLPRNTIRALAEDSSGTLWIGTGKGLVSLSTRGELTPFRFSGFLPSNDLEGLNWNKIRALAPAQNGRLWVGHEQGLHDFHPSGSTSLRFTHGLPKPDDVRALLSTPDGNLWLGTFGGGLGLLSNRQFFHYTTTNIPGLPSDRVWAFHLDAQNTLWIGTENGLARLKDGRFESFTTAHGLPANLVNSVLEDDLGFLWITHEHGIYRVRKTDFDQVSNGNRARVDYLALDESDGMPGRETNGQKSQPAAIKRRNGELWFSTTKGVAIVNPAQIDALNPPPIPVVEDLRANDSLAFQTAPGAANKATLSLDPGSGRILEFHFTGNTFVAPEKTRFRFRLAGYEDSWHDAGTRRVAFYTNLRPGDYRFEVLAGNHRNVWSATPASLPFTILPFYYQTALFWTCLCSLAAAILWAIHRYRIRHDRQLEQLQSQLALASERNRIAQDLHDGIGSALTQLQLLANLAERETPAAAANGSIRKITDCTRRLNDNLREIIWLARPESQTLESLLSRVSDHAVNLCHVANINCRIDLPHDLPAAPLPASVAHHLYYALKEAITNSVKHSGANNLAIAAHFDSLKSALSICIHDDGRGFETSQKPAGNGLTNIRSRAQQIGATLNLKTSPNAGASIELYLPLRSNG